MKVSVLDADTADEDVDKSVLGLQLDDISGRSLSMTVKFADSAAISSNILEPDKLEIHILEPHVFMDAETYELLEPEFAKISLTCQPQRDEKAMEDLVTITAQL